MKKILFKGLSMILVLCLCIQIIPPRMLKVMAADETILNVLNGNITINDKTYTQKDSKGVIVASGTVTNDDIILTGAQNNGYNVTVSGTNLPTIRYRNVTTNGLIDGDASGNLNIKLEGNCNFYNWIFGPLPNIKNFSITGVTGNLITGLNNISTVNTTGSIRPLLIANLNFKGNVSMASYGDITIDNCNFSDKTFIISYIARYSYSSLSVKNCNFNYLWVSAACPMLLDNVTSLSGIINNQQFSYPDIQQIIKNSNLKLQSYILGYGVFKIVNSNIEFNEPGIPLDIRASTNTSLFIEGSTITTPNTNSFDFLTYTDTGIFIKDSSLNLNAVPYVNNGTSNDYTRFIKNNGSSYTKFDPLDGSGNRLFLNKIKVPNSSVSKVNVSIDGRSAVSLITDSQGYLYLYLPTGQHTVKVTDANGIMYSKTFTGAATNDTDMTDNEIGTLETEIQTTKIITPYINSNIQYSFDYSNWYNALTDNVGNFSAAIPADATRLYIKLTTTGEMKYIDIVDGVLGTVKDVGPSIKNQSESTVTFLKGTQGILYVEAVPFNSGNTLTYQWKKDGKVIEGAIKPVYTIPSVKDTDAGSYSCTVLESDGKSIVSNPITVTISNLSSDKELLEQISILTEQVNTLQSQLITTNANNAELKNKITELETQIADLNGQISLLQTSKAEIEDKMKQEEKNNGELNETIEKLNNQISELNQIVTTRESELKDAVNNLHTLEEKVNKYNNDLTDLQSQITNLNKKIADSEKENQQLKDQISTLQNNISNFEENINELQKNLEDANNISALLMEELEKASSDLEALKIEKDNRIIELESILATANSTIEELKQQIAKLTGEKDAILSENTSLKEENERLKEEINALKGQSNSSTPEKNN